jgi:hypothetical protein
MKRALIMPTIAMTILTCHLAAQTATPPQQEQKVFVVPGNKDWTDTGFVLKRGDRVTAKASGRIYFNERSDSSVGSNGLDGDYKSLRPEDYAACADPLPNENHACLIAKINNEVFKLGSNITFSGKEGKLYLGINDCTLTGKLGNSGLFGVNIKIERDAIAAKK